MELKDVLRPEPIEEEYTGHGAACPKCNKRALVYLNSSRKQCFNCNAVIDASYDD